VANAPQYPFGYGLSYTSFSLSNLHVSPGSVSASGKVTVSADITNTGSVAGDDVAQLYIHQDGTTLLQPVRRLDGFQRVTLAPGKAKTVTFTLGRDQIGFYNNQGQFEVDPGTVKRLRRGQLERRAAGPVYGAVMRRRLALLAALAVAVLALTTAPASAGAGTAPVSAYTGLTGAQRSALLGIARDTWKFYQADVDPGTHLPLDNLTFAGGSATPTTYGRYTSASNIGVYLWAVVSARDLGLISRPRARDLIEATLTEGRAPETIRRVPVPVVRHH